MSNDSASDDGFNATTTGVSLDISCRAGDAKVAWLNASALTASTSVLSQQGDNVSCVNHWFLRQQYSSDPAADDDPGDPAVDGTSASSDLTPRVQYAAEFFPPFEQPNGDSGPCNNVVLAAWLRANQVGRGPVLAYNATSNTPIIGTILTCRSSLRVSLYNVRADAAGHVQQSDELTQASDLQHLSVNSSVAKVYAQVPINALTNTAGTQDWHNATRTGSKYYRHLSVQIVILKLTT